MAERIVSPRARLIPTSLGETEAAASDPVPLEEEESLASLAALSGVDLSNRAVTSFVQSFSAATINQLQGATQ